MARGHGQRGRRPLPPRPATRGAERVLFGLALFLGLSLLLPTLAAAACLPIAWRHQPLLHRAADEGRRAPAPGTVALTFLGHASFLIETPAGATAVTDYNGTNTPPFVPDIVTMNNAHPSHYTDAPDPLIKYVLRGWDPGGGIAVHHIEYRDLRVRNVPTNVRDEGGTRFNGNSIFVFEVSNLCIAHLGHLHHTLTDTHLGELGQIDVLLVPVDGAFTMSQVDMVEVIREVAPPLVIPMHFFNETTLARFLDRMRATHVVKASETPTVVLSREALPSGRPEVLVLPGS
jgi:L-ascorbate metabolism protein UlaG (beta-lactamase superfamily)